MQRKGWLSSVALLAIVAGLANGIYSLSDAHVLARYFQDPNDKTIGSFIYIIIGSWIGCITFIPQAKLMGKLVSRKEFQGLHKPIGKDWLYVCSTGITAAGTTFFYLYGLSKYGPAQVVVLSAGALVLLFMFDFARKRVDLALTIPAIIVLAGLLLSSIDFKEGINISIELILVVLVARNILLVISTWTAETGTRRMDAVNFNFWRFLSFAIFATIFIGGWVVVTGKVEIFGEVLASGFLGALPFILFTMFFGFFESVFESQARRDGGKLSMVSFLKESAIIPALSLTYLVNWLWAGSVGDVVTDPKLAAIKVVAAVIVIYGLYLLTRKKLVEEEEEEAVIIEEVLPEA